MLFDVSLVLLFFLADALRYWAFVARGLGVLGNGSQYRPNFGRILDSKPLQDGTFFIGYVVAFCTPKTKSQSLEYHISNS